jgi:WD40 repeat protein
MMAKDPARRFQQPLEVAQALAPFLEAGAGPIPVPAGQGTGLEGRAPIARVISPTTATPVIPGTLIEGRDTIARARGLAPAGPAPSGSRGRRWWLLGAGVAGLVLAGVLGLWAAGVFRAKTAEGVLIVQVNEPSPDVYVDGSKMAVTWEDGGKTAVIRLRPGTRKVEVKKEGLSAFGEEVDVQPGRHRVVTVRLVRPAPDSTEAYDPTGGERFVHFGRGRPRVVLRYNDRGGRGAGKKGPKLHFVRVYDLEAGTPVTPPLRMGGPVSLAAFSTDGKVLGASGEKGSSGEVRLWSAGTDNLLFPPLKIDYLRWCAFSFDSKRLVTINSDGQTEGTERSWARRWDATTGKEIIPPIEYVGNLPHACFSPDGKRVATAEWRSPPKKDECLVRIWDAATGAELTPPLRHKGSVIHALFSPDGQRVVTINRHYARIWDAASGKECAPPLEHVGDLSAARFSPDSQRVVTAAPGDQAVRVWDAATGQGVTPWLHHPYSTRMLYATFSSDSKRVVTAGAIGGELLGAVAARVWDAATGAELTPPLRHEGSVLRATFSPDGKRVVTLSQRWQDGREWEIAQLWDAQSGKELKKVVISPD